jgi:hypothetical protein
MKGIERILGFLPYERMHPNGCPLVAAAEIEAIFHLAPPKRNHRPGTGDPKCATIAPAYGILSRYAGELDAPATEYLKVQNSPI